MNSFIILLVISMLFLDVFFSVSNKAIVVVFLAGRVEAGGGLGDSRRVSPTPVRRCHSTQEALSKASTTEASHGGGQAAAGQDYHVKVQVHEVA